MANQSKRIRIALQLVILCLFVLFIYLLYVLFPFYKQFVLMLLHVLFPFLMAGLIAYLLHPVVEKIHHYHIPRPVAILIIYFLFFAGTGLGIYYSLPVFIHQLRELQSNIPQFMDAYRSFVYNIYSQTSFLPEEFHDRLDVLFHDAEDTLGDRVTGFVKNIPMLFDIFVMLAVIPILAFYFLKDYQILGRGILRVIPSKFQDFTKTLAKKIEDSLGQYLRGQILVCFLVGFVSFLLLKWIGMNYALILGIIIGLTNFIPYFGPILGAIPTVLIALTISTKMVIYVIGVVLVVQILEGNLLSPFIVGKSIHIHPVYLIFALFLAAKVAGIIGMLLAIPLLAIGRVSIPFIMKQVKQIDR
ncbi:AI-2E family transporter [Gracilibacillus sp. YIM 98692]|uniref:AI-2E family transporter n=1 Tax=Gracilibacillus sp. YIM 98692 TaxID=2663532 RepID=UPI0013D6872A|nr:AI-2E family transporter [Gracilibacillus sp. YIM 98692]